MLELRDIHKDYEGVPLLNGVSFTVAPHETVCLLGASGSGKSTLLRIIAGLEGCDSGEVYWNGEEQSNVPVHRRGFGLMFQDYALFPHRSVAENVAFGLRMQRLAKADIDKQVQQALEKVNMTDFGSRRVTDLSGGEQQRVALARSLAAQPRLLMLDEPLSALDHNLREQLSEELRNLLHQSGVPAIYVTHDQEEAFAIADRLILLHEGRVQQSGSPAEVYDHPATAWAARFLGMGNLLDAVVASSQPLRLKSAAGLFQPSSHYCGSLSIGERVTLLLRPNGAVLQDLTQDGAETNCLKGVVEDSFFQRQGYRLNICCSGGITLQFNIDRYLQPGEEVRLRLDAGSMVCL